MGPNADVLSSVSVSSRESMLQLQHKALYAAFDVYPSAKGAATHIHHMSQTMFSTMDGGLLCSLGHPKFPAYQKEKNIELLKFQEPIPHFLERTLAYGRWLRYYLKSQWSSLELCHFRDPWSGVPLLTAPDTNFKSIYEVNGLPSIELSYRYPHITPATLDKIRQAEIFCWEHADLLITPSQVLCDNLVALGIPAEKIEVIPNGAALSTVEHPAPIPTPYILYFGAVQPWQGIDVLLKAFARLQDIPTLRLVILSSVKPRHSKQLRKLARKLGLEERVDWHYQLSKSALEPWLTNALLTVAPLTECSRNLNQGCCPLKILESMAAGTPVVASDLEVVREIMQDREHGKLVRPDRPDALARALRIALEYPDQLVEMGKKAQKHIEEHYTWDHISHQLTAVYKRILER